MKSFLSKTRFPAFFKLLECKDDFLKNSKGCKLLQSFLGPKIGEYITMSPSAPTKIEKRSKHKALVKGSK